MAVKYLCDEFAGVTFQQRPCKITGIGADGYGRKITTNYTAKVGNKTHRVYCMCFSNAGSLYVLKNGEEYFVRNYDIEV